MVRITRKLTQELLSDQKQNPQILEQNYCAIAQKLQCCDGIGYKHHLQGAYLQTSLCECVESCKTCFGKVRHLVDRVSIPCRTPSPARIVSILNHAQIPSRYGIAKLDNFSNFTGNGREVLHSIALWLREFKPRSPQGLLLGGPVGVGKTYLLAAVAKNFAARGLSVKFVDFFQLLNEIKSAYSNSRSDANILKPLIDIDVLFIDELGKGRSSDWEMSIIDQIIMGRYNQNKVVVASTNYGLKPEKQVPMHQKDLSQESFGSFNLDRFESLEKRIGERIYSRLVETSQLMELTGEDFRKQFFTPKAGLLQQKPSSKSIERGQHS